MKYPHLFQPIKIGNTLFKNRIFSAPTGHADSVMGRFTESTIAFFERKAQGGAAVVTLGEAAVDSKYGKAYASMLSLDSRQPWIGLSEMADRISRHGAVASIELQHMGMKATPGVITPGVAEGSNTIYGPSACEYHGVKVQEMPEELILEIIEKFADAAKFVKDRGFGMVLVHGGHGWLINQFLCERTNRRTDRWGGTVENRTRLAIEICDAIHRKCGRGFPVEMRITSSEGVPGGYTEKYAAQFAALLYGHADIIHCSAGFGDFLPENPPMLPVMCPSMFQPEGVNVPYAAAVKQAVRNTPIAVVGALSDPEMMEDIIASGKADIVELARGLICDPDLPNKARDGRDSDIIKCMRCYNCFSNAMQRGAMWCAINPETNRDLAFAPLRGVPAKQQRVLVVGGGIAGMEAALTAEKNGHSVILCEKADRLGGHIRCEESVPFKKNLIEYIRRQERRISASSIDLRLCTEVTPDYAKAVGADAIIAALGSRPIKPPIPGIDGKNVISADEAYIHPETVGSGAVILGGGLVGMELAIYLESLGKKTTVVEMLPEFSVFPNVLLGEAVLAQLKNSQVITHFGTKAIKIDDCGVWCETGEGKQYFEASTVIYAVGQQSLSAETAALYDCAVRFYPIGDCVQPRNIAEATIAARSVAENIGRV